MDRSVLGSSTRSRPSPRSTTTLLGKRDALEAGIDDPHTLLRNLHESENRYTSLKRQFNALQGVEQNQRDEIRDLKGDMEVLRQHRSNLVNGSKDADTTAEKNDKAWETERMESRRQIRDLTTRNNRIRDENELLNSECSTLNSKYSQLEASSSSELITLRNRLSEVESNRDELKGWQRRAESLSIEIEELKRRNGSRSRAQQDNMENEDDKALRKELKDQKQRLSHLSTTLDRTRGELATIHKERKEWLDSRKQQLETESNLRNDVKNLHDQLDRARRDMDSLTQSFPSDSEPSESASALQAKCTTLANLHHQATLELASKNSELDQLRGKHVEYVNTSRITVSDLTKQNTELSRNLRWAEQGRDQAERREALIRKELDQMDGPMSHTMPGGLNSGDQMAQIRKLQTLVEEYKAEIDRTARDSRDLENQLAEGAGLVKSTLLDTAQTRIESLESQIESLEASISELTSANTALDAEVSDLMRRVASGEYNPSNSRVIEFKANPAAKVLAVRTQQLDDLRAENEALLARLKIADQGKGEQGGDGAVPRESWDRLVKEKETMEQAHAKRLQRLKEIFGNKSKEFLDSVYSLLGWRIKFDESGSDIRLSSMYAPKGKMGLTLKFTSQEGHFGTMAMSGGMARGLEESRHFWIVERQSVPGFLAQVTTEMFEKTTIGRAAGYVGLEQ